MRSRLLPILAAAAAILLAARSCSDSQFNPEMDFSEVLGSFSDPGPEFRAMPLWVWNTDVTEADIDAMLGELKDQGFGGAFVHPRPGLVTEYLSDEWFHLWKYALAKAGELGMSLSIYDENSYPSGFAGGLVPDAMPESYNQGQGLVRKAVSETAPEDTTCFMTVELGGKYYSYDKSYKPATSWNAGFPYVDLLYEGVTDKFIELTFKPYEKALGREMGRSVKAFFSDEPEISSPGGARWSPGLFDAFEKQWGYSLADNWPLLEEETGDWRVVRHDYNAVLLKMFIDGWSRPMHDYAEKRNMYWTGHYWEHNWPSLGTGPDNMAMYYFHQMPAIDMLFNQFNDVSPMAQFGNVRSVKELRSVANQTGAVRTLSETYGGGGWDETFADFKRLGDWEYALGVNLMNQHLCHMTITGTRKYDYPPVFTSLSPWWDDYRVLNDYFARLSLVLSQGRQENDVLILEPTTSLWQYFTSAAENMRLYEIGNTFQSFITGLEKKQLEYDLGSEYILGEAGSVKNGRLVVGKASYSTVVIPPLMENIETPTMELLRKFKAEGGRIVAFSRPCLLDGREDRSLASLFEGALTPESADGLIGLCPAGGGFTMSSESLDVYHHRRTYKDGQLLFVANSSKTEKASAEITLDGKYLYLLDAMDGTISLAGESAEGRLSFEAALEPAGSALYYASDRAVEGAGAARACPEGGHELAGGPLAVEALEKNALTLDFCRLCAEDRDYGKLYTVEASRTLYAHFGMSNPWESAVQFRSRTVEADTLTTGDIDVVYEFESGLPGGKLEATVERPDLWTVSVNGHTMSAFKPSFLDRRMGVFDISEYVTEGINTLTLHLDDMKLQAEIAPVILTGDFAVEPRGAGFALAPATALGTGSWKDQGMPFYSWGVSYRRSFEIEEPAGSYEVSLGDWKGTVCEVKVGGEKAGIIFSRPYTLDITDHIKAGTNDVEVVVIGSLRNLYGPHYGSEKGIMGPWMWNNVSSQLPGSAYEFFDYGLYDSFTLIAY